MGFLFFNTIIYVHLTRDMSTFSIIPSMLRNFLLVYEALILISLTPAKPLLTKYSPSSNLIGLDGGDLFL